MSFKIAEKEFSKTVGRVVTVENGKRKTETKTQKITLSVPELDIRSISNLEDIARDSAEIMKLGLPGFRDISAFVEIFNVGSVAALQKSLRTGADVRRSQTQNQIYTSYLNLVKIGAMTAGPNDGSKPDALALLAMANMGDACDEFLAALAASETDDADDDEESEASEASAVASNAQRSA